MQILIDTIFPYRVPSNVGQIVSLTSIHNQLLIFVIIQILCDLLTYLFFRLKSWIQKEYFVFILK